ncbi:SCO3374 family protein [Streptomyces sp. NPDC058045]|uniref:SCO3374 family protein n=1 Tax=Streptomyces sp. NPDC058045 TaxID=3346311 RepID=UPI0036EEE841
MTPRVPTPRSAPESTGPVERWYRRLGWTSVTVPGTGGATPLRLAAGLRFDVLELPAEAGFAVLRALRPRCPVALQDDTVRLLVAVGGADELPGLLAWLEWGELPLGLTALGAGGCMDAPLPPGPHPRGTSMGQGAAVWLRPPEPGSPVEATLPALPSPAAPHRPTAGPDLVRLVTTAATQCHRVGLRGRGAQRWASSYA